MPAPIYCYIGFTIGAMKAEINKNNELVITVPLTAPRPSDSGKMLMVASSGGFVQTTAEVDGKPIKISLNAGISSR